MQATLFLHRLLTCATLAICFGGAALLLWRSLRGPEKRARRALAFILTMWGLAYLTECLPCMAGRLHEFEPMSVSTLIVGNLYIIVALLYPLEVARPGWITPRRVALLALPFAAIAGLYLLVLALRGEPVLRLDSLDDLIGHWGEFNVWYRSVLYLSVCFYMAFLWLNTSVTAILMHRRTHDDYTPLARQQVRLLRSYGIGIVCIAFVYLGVLLDGSLTSRLVYRVVLLLFFTSAVLQALGGRTPQTDEISERA